MSELAGLSFSALQQVFRKGDIEIAFSLDALPLQLDQTVFVCVDPGAGGPQSDYAVVSIARTRGTVQVSAPIPTHASSHASSHAARKSCTLCFSLVRKSCARRWWRSS